MNNFAELSDGDGATFLVRWRGRQEGPHPASVIEAKLVANEIGLLHEIFFNGKWITLRNYITEREAILRAENQARQEQERLAREQAERQVKEREEGRREESLAEERRRSAQLESVQTRGNSTQHLNQPTPTTNGRSSGLRALGALLLIAGLAVTAYFFLAYDTSVESSVGRVNNLGLMATRQNGIIIGIGLGIVGTIMLAIGSRGKN
jgi:hypothetical protein